VPVRIESLADPTGVVIETPTPPGAADRAVVIPEEGVTLVRLDVDRDRYAADGKYYEGVVQVPNWIAEGLTGYFGFETFGYVDPEIPGLPAAQVASLAFQLSNDNGATWRIWVDGPDEWVSAVGPLAGVFNDEETVDRRIPLFPFISPKQLKIRVKLTSGANGLQKPVLQNIYIYNSHIMEIYEDVTRSMKRYIDANVAVPMHYMAELASPSSTVAIEKDVGLDVKVMEPITVYNLGVDPGRNINLFGSLGGVDGRTITMIGPQVGQVEVNFTGVPDVFVSAEEFLNISKIPSIVVYVTRMEQYLDIRSWVPERERSLSRMEGRSQAARVYYKITATVRVQSSLKREALRMTDILCRLLDQGSVFNSVASGEGYGILEQSNEVSEDRIAQGLHVGAITILIMGKTWLQGEEAEHLVHEVGLSIGSEHTCNLLLPVHLRRVYREKVEIKE
jgi:hypothetical protein